MIMAMRPATKADTQTDLATQRTRTRDEGQKALDTDVAALVKEWEAADGPSNGNPNRRYEVDDVAEAKRRVNRAFTLVAKDMTPKLAPMWWKDGTKDAEGYVAIKFGVRVSTPAETKAAADAEKETPKADGETPKAEDKPPFDEGSGDQGGDQPQTDQSGGRGFRRGR